MGVDELPPRWKLGGPAKGLWLPDGSIVTWLIDEHGHPTHDQGAKLIGVSLLDCDALYVREDGRIEDAMPNRPADVFQRDVVRYDSDLWISDADWSFL
ncbi:MAG TPA: hypothetical protein VN892_17590 [Solirubrobacteraceae bacterium]|nr:hypothetical protein [Solirubrobacteraceae bacterium]